MPLRVRALSVASVDEAFPDTVRVRTVTDDSMTVVSESSMSVSTYL